MRLCHIGYYILIIVCILVHTGLSVTNMMIQPSEVRYTVESLSITQNEETNALVQDLEAVLEGRMNETDLCQLAVFHDNGSLWTQDNVALAIFRRFVEQSGLKYFQCPVLIVDKGADFAPPSFQNMSDINIEFPASISWNTSRDQIKEDIRRFSGLVNVAGDAYVNASAPLQWAFEGARQRHGTVANPEDIETSLSDDEDLSNSKKKDIHHEVIDNSGFELFVQWIAVVYVFILYTLIAKY